MRNAYSEPYRYGDPGQHELIPDDNGMIQALVADERARGEYVSPPAIVLAVRPTSPTDFYAYCSGCQWRSRAYRARAKAQAVANTHGVMMHRGEVTP